MASVHTAHDPEGLRGPQFDAAWVDELAKWKRGQEAWDQLQFALRLGDQPQVCVTTTPRNVGVLKTLLAVSSTVVTHAKTEANKAHLAGSFLEEVRRRYAGTRLGRQELDGVLLSDAEGALWTSEMIEAAQIAKPPVLTRTGFSSNPVGFRSVKLIAEAAALPLILQDWERRYDVHPLLDLVTRPNAGQGRAKLMEALFQFRDAELVSAGTFALSHRLRGQLGSDALMPGIWPAGSWFVLLNGVPSQINMAENLRHIEQNFQIGPAVRPNNDPSYVAQSHVFEGVGLRPYAPVHLRKSGTPDHEFNWIRRTRLDGDDWTLPDVPLNEETESY